MIISCHLTCATFFHQKFFNWVTGGNRMRNLFRSGWPVKAAENVCGGGCIRLLSQTSNGGLETEVIIAMGSNLGNRWKNLTDASKAMGAKGIKILHHSSLYESAPAHVVDQPNFLNAAVLALTTLSPRGLLQSLKDIEQNFGRDLTSGIRYGPRPLDLDIIAFGNSKVDDDVLQIPHKRWRERDFVMAPVTDLGQFDQESSIRIADITRSVKPFCRSVMSTWMDRRSSLSAQTNDLHRVVPLGICAEDNTKGITVRRLGSGTLVMGILNCTPDSFSDGGRYLKTDSALEQARRMVQDGADIIDVGGQSTRPGASCIPAEEEATRVLPIIKELTEDPITSKVLISVDTFYGSVAKAAVETGAHIINDVSGGTLDEEMLHSVASLAAPYVCMHMRGTPQTMQGQKMIAYEDVCTEVASELQNRVEQAMLAGIAGWNIVLDPGIGFAKSHSDNVNLIAGLSRMQGSLQGTCQHMPILIGASRKGFLSSLTRRRKAEDRDVATVAVSVAAILGGAEIIRTHNVTFMRDAVCVADALNCAMMSQGLK